MISPWVCLAPPELLCGHCLPLSSQQPNGPTSLRPQHPQGNALQGKVTFSRTKNSAQSAQAAAPTERGQRWSEIRGDKPPTKFSCRPGRVHCDREPEGVRAKRPTDQATKCFTGCKGSPESSAEATPVTRSGNSCFLAFGQGRTRSGVGSKKLSGPGDRGDRCKAWP